MPNRYNQLSLSIFLLVINCPLFSPLAAGDALPSHQFSEKEAQSAYAELNRLLAKLDAIDRVDDLAATARKASDAAALAASAKAGGAGINSDPNLFVPKAETVVAVGSNSISGPQNVNLVNDVKGPGLITSQAEDPKQQANELLKKMGFKHPGPHAVGGQQIFIAVSPPVTIKHSPQSPGYVTSREIAYLVADMRARADIAKYLMTEIIRERNFSERMDESFSEVNPSPGEAALAKAQQVADNELDAELRKLNVDPQIYTAKSPNEKRAILQSQYLEQSKIKAKELLAGIGTLFVCEGPIGSGTNAIVVALLWSERTAKLCNLAFSPRLAGKPVPENSLVLAAAKLPLDNPVQLVRYFGAQMITDGAGNPWIFGFGQAGYRSDHQVAIATTQAEINARAALAAFVNEMIDEETSGKKLEMYQEFDDASAKALAETATIQQIRGNTKWTSSGIVKVADCTTTINGAKVCIAVVAWSPFSRSQAESMRQKMKDALTNPQGAAEERTGKTMPQPGAQGAGHSGISEF